MTDSHNIYLGISGHVVCIDRETGRENWRTKLKNSQLTNIMIDNNTILAYAGGHLYAVNIETGKILWENTLKGLGYSTAILASPNAQSIAYASAQQAQGNAVAQQMLLQSQQDSASG